MKVFLCGFGQPGYGVFMQLMSLVDQVAIFTHESLPNAPSLAGLGISPTLESVNNTEIWPFQPDMIISIYYRYIIKPHVIKAVGGNVFNAHPSLLPLHRGCSSIPWAIIDNDTHTGVTYHYIDEGIDTGPIITQAVCQIAPDETQLSLSEKINRLVIDTFPVAFNAACMGVRGYDQQGRSSYHPRQVPYNREINPNWTWHQIERFIRAMIYPPYPPATFKGREIYTLQQYVDIFLEDKYQI